MSATAAVAPQVKRSVGQKVYAAGPFLAVHAACGLVVFYPPTLQLLALAGAGYVLRMWAVTAGYHRYFAHRAYKTSRAFQLVLATLGGTAMQQGPLWWASWHRRHHKFADKPGDPHSPEVDGFWHSHVGWIFDGNHGSSDFSNVKDLAAFPELRWLEKHSYVPVAGYAVVCLAIAGPAGVVWGFAISSVALAHMTFLINSVAHIWGSRPFETADTSRNNALLAVLTFGEGWHNNHHYYMTSARQGFRWWQIDLSYYSLRVLAWLGVVWNLREPPRHPVVTGHREDTRRSGRKRDCVFEPIEASWVTGCEGPSSPPQANGIGRAASATTDTNENFAVMGRGPYSDPSPE